MKTVILALLVLLVISQGEALRCHCVRDRDCSGPIQTCTGPTDVCYFAVAYIPDLTIARGCTPANECRTMRFSDHVVSSGCCRGDLCNKFGESNK
ncbi:lymphocyte antigen 6D-like [Thunnus albacares]|uniref:lymphocyte antigen 6D-like n=1 Tax=Thunnus albacares TaxID=8236 RepID=UPI001CF6AFD7|nr:lymphocyte antigen 6D-like [Thunnus albacares]